MLSQWPRDKNHVLEIVPTLNLHKMSVLKPAVSLNYEPF